MTLGKRFRMLWRLWQFLCILALLGAGVFGGVFLYLLFERPTSDPLFDEDPPSNVHADIPQITPVARRPNIILILCDDLGYGDLGCYGATAIATPHIDRLAEEGVRFTEFYASNSVCTPSRAGLLTGRYAQRSGMGAVLMPENEPAAYRAPKNFGQLLSRLGLVDFGPDAQTTGLPASELTLAEALRMADYRTGMVGKWHLGDYSRNHDHNPLHHGFDCYYGVPHSNDMLPLPLYRDDQLLEQQVQDQSKLTGQYTSEAVAFIEQSSEKPFFLYFAHTFPHQPLFASEQFRGKSHAGLYGDTVEEIDWSVGEIMACLQRNRLSENTLVLFTSDNGPWFEGDSGGYRGRKGQSYEGGYRVPLIARYPSVIPAGTVCSEPAMNIDVFPTSLHLAGLELPQDRIIDGCDILGLMTGEIRQTPHNTFYFYHVDELEAVRQGHWKFVRNIHQYVWPIPIDKPTRLAGQLSHGRLARWPLLFDLSVDPHESYNLIDNFPQEVARLRDEMERWEQGLKENVRGWVAR